jgi:hypothetical protein
MSLDNDTVYFSETDSDIDCEYSLYVDNYPVVLNSTYLNCVENLKNITNDNECRYTDRKFILDKEGDNFTLLSFPKNYPTTYERVELKAEIIRED